MTKHTYSVEPRQVTGRKVKSLRKQGIVPGSIFGKNVESKNIQFNAKSFTKLRDAVGESSLLYLVTPDKTEHPVIVRDVEVHPVTGQMLHVSFNQVSLREKVSAPVTIKLEGESPADRDKLGILVQQLDEVEVEALPTDIPEAFIVDVSILTEVDQSVTVGDLKVDASKISIQTDPETVIVKVEPLAAEETEAAPAEAAEGEAEATSEASTEEKSEESSEKAAE